MTPEQQVAQSMEQAGAAAAGFILTLFIFALVMFAVWLWMLINCLIRPGRSFPGGDGSARVAWAVLLIFIPFLGQLLYFFIVYLPGRRGRSVNKPQAYYSDRR